MAAPVTFAIVAEGATWTLSRDGEPMASYSHLDRATHDAVRHARELEEGGEPAEVRIHAAEGKVITIDTGPQVTQAEERQGPDSAPDAAME